MTHNITQPNPKCRITEADTYRCSYKKVFWKYAANLLESTHAEVWFQILPVRSSTSTVWDRFEYKTFEK